MPKQLQVKSLQEREPELAVIANEVIDMTCRAINEKAREAKTDFPYKAQAILEMVISELEKRV